MIQTITSSYNFLSRTMMNLILKGLLALVVLNSYSQSAMSTTSDTSSSEYDYFFHWGDQASNNELLETLDDQGRLTEESVKFLHDSYTDTKAYVAGQGLYLSNNPFDSQRFGNSVLILKIKKVAIPERNIKAENDSATTKAKRDQLPLISKYSTTWYVMPRAYKPGDPDFSISSKYMGEYLPLYIKSIKAMTPNDRVQKILDLLFGFFFAKASEAEKGSDQNLLFQFFEKEFSTNRLFSSKDILSSVESLLKYEPHPTTVNILEFILETQCAKSLGEHSDCQRLKFTINNGIAKKISSTPMSEIFAFSKRACEKGFLTPEICLKLKNDYKKAFLSQAPDWIAKTLDIYLNSTDEKIEFSEYFDLDEMLNVACGSSEQLGKCTGILILQFHKDNQILKLKTLDRIIGMILQYAQNWPLDSATKASLFLGLNIQLKNRTQTEAQFIHKKYELALAKFLAGNYSNQTSEIFLLEAFKFFKNSKWTFFDEIFGNTSSSNSFLLNFNYQTLDVGIRKKISRETVNYLSSKVSGCTTVDCLKSSPITLRIVEYLDHMTSKRESINQLPKTVLTISQAKYYKILVLASIAIYPDKKYQLVKGEVLEVDKIFKLLSKGLGLSYIQTPEMALEELLKLNREKKAIGVQAQTNSCSASF